MRSRASCRNISTTQQLALMSPKLNKEQTLIKQHVVLNKSAHTNRTII